MFNDISNSYESLSSFIYIYFRVRMRTFAPSIGFDQLLDTFDETILFDVKSSRNIPEDQMENYDTGIIHINVYVSKLNQTLYEHWSSIKTWHTQNNNKQPKINYSRIHIFLHTWM